VLKHGGEHDLAELRRKLEQMLSHHLADQEIANALEMLDEHLPGQRYGQAEDEEGEEHPGQTKMRRFLEDRGVAEEDIEMAAQRPRQVRARAWRAVPGQRDRIDSSFEIETSRPVCP
jgi:hypothetical protein